jgi:hypothetical protein
MPLLIPGRIFSQREYRFIIPVLIDNLFPWLIIIVFQNGLKLMGNHFEISAVSDNEA